MGSIRTLLAISVLVTHSDALLGVTLLNGDMAITCFFMISGFLMALILERKYDDKRRFYLNRALRIYPPYFAALLFSVVIFATIDSERHDPLGFLERLWNNGNFAGIALGVLANLTLVGVDLTRYISFDNGIMQVPSFIFEQGAGGHNLLFVPQAWTLAVELEFYLLAPFLVRARTLVLLLLTIALFLLRYSVIDVADRFDGSFGPNALLPLALCYFLCGMLAYRAYCIYERLALPGRLRLALEYGAVAASLVLIVVGRALVYRLDLPSDAFYVAFAALLPLLFAFSKGRRWDAWAGEFSYPVYLLHFAVAQLFYRLGIADHWVGELTLLSTLLLSAAYIYSIDRPLQRLRARIAAGAGAEPERRVVEVPAR